VAFENYYNEKFSQTGNNSNQNSGIEPGYKNVASMSLQDLVKQTEPSVFLVITYNDEDKVIGTGTGFFIDTEGVALSNYHVFKGGSRWSIKTKDERYYNIDEVLDYDKDKDFIIFKVGDVKDPVSLKLSSSLPGKGEDIFVLGNPHGLESTVTKGVVSAIRSWYSKNDFIQIDAPISPGSSGSPVLNMKGEVIGIATLKIIEECESCNFAINIELVKQQLKKY
jgi:serine protease Do